jgi:hypothetical protein
MTKFKDTSRFHWYTDWSSFSVGFDFSNLKWNPFWKYSLGINLGFWYGWIYFKKR